MSEMVYYYLGTLFILGKSWLCFHSIKKKESTTTRSHKIWREDAKEEVGNTVIYEQRSPEFAKYFESKIFRNSELPKRKFSPAGQPYNLHSKYKKELSLAVWTGGTQNQIEDLHPLKLNPSPQSSTICSHSV